MTTRTMRMPERRCKRCDRMLPLIDFPIRGTGRSWRCAECLFKRRQQERAAKVAPARKHEPTTPLEWSLCVQLRAARVPEPVWQFRWHATRRWRADGCYEAERLLIECDGGVTPFRDRKTGELRQGGHNTITGFDKDTEKHNEAAILGWRVLRFSRRQIDSGYALATIERALGRNLAHAH